MPEVSGDAALLIDPSSVEEIQKGMICLLCDESFRLELSNKGKEQVKKFSWKYTAQQTYNTYKERAFNVKLLMDVTPLQSEHRNRGVGTYVKELTKGLDKFSNSDFRYIVSNFNVEYIGFFS